MENGVPFPPPFLSFDKVLNDGEIEILSKECEEIFNAKSKRGKYSSGQSFFLHCTETCISNVEAFALRLFGSYTKNIKFDDETSGVEFWPLVIETVDDVGAHYDKGAVRIMSQCMRNLTLLTDYGVEDENMDIFPWLGTVTYLCDIGCPTIFFEQTEKEELPCHIKTGYLSQVKRGKHVCFDGRFLHCGSSDLLDAMQRNVVRKRITLLINIWLNHIPADPVRCELISPNISVSSNAPFPKPDVLETVQNVGDREMHKVKMMLDKRRRLKFLCKSILTFKTSSVKMTWEEGGCILEMKKNKKKGKKKKEKKEKKKKEKKRK